MEFSKKNFSTKELTRPVANGNHFSSSTRVVISSTKNWETSTINALGECSAGKGIVCAYWSSDSGRLRDGAQEPGPPKNNSSITEDQVNYHNLH